MMEKTTASGRSEMEEVAEKTTNEKKKIQDIPEVHLIVFRLGEEYYGIPIEQVKEVTYTPSISKMPKAPAFIKGVANIRGDILAVMDLEERLGIEKKLSLAGTKPIGKYTLVIESAEQMIGIIVEEVPFSLNVRENLIEKAKALIEQSRIADGYIQGIAKTTDKLIVIIDIQQIINF